jgi:hypothetical protein
VSARAVVSVLFIASTAHAYRPFDGTDADVATTGDIEVELGPVHYLAETQSHQLLAPAVVLNLAILHRVEFVLESRNAIPIDATPPDSNGMHLYDTGAYLKTVLREGVLQGKSGLSVATEIGPLLPNLGGESGVGAQALFIVSHRWTGGTLHLDGAGLLTRAHNPGFFGGAILEGPITMPVRPVAEAFTQQELGEGYIVSGLVGAIWHATEGLDFDLGLREGRASVGAVHEIRLGLTWTFAVVPSEK